MSPGLSPFAMSEDQRSDAGLPSPEDVLPENMFAAPMVKSDTAQVVHEAAGEYLTFCVGREEYGIDILRVQEIRVYDPPTRIPHAPDYIKGVMNLRGLIVPVVDTRLKLGQGDTPIHVFSVVIIVRVTGQLWGFLVDAVNDVLMFNGASIRPVPAFDGSVDTRYMKGIGNLKGRIVVLTDIDRFLSTEDLAALRSL